MNAIDPNATVVTFQATALAAASSMSLAQAYQTIGDVIAAGQLPQALTITDQLLDQHPQYLPLLWMKAYILDLQGVDLTLRLAFCDKALALDSQHQNFLLMKGDLLRKLERHEASIDHLDASIALHPNSWELYFSLGLSLLESGNSDRAELAFREVLKKNKQCAAAWFQLIGISKFSRKDLDKMQLLLKKKTTAAGDAAQLGFAIAAYWRQLGEVGREMQSLKRANDQQKSVKPFDTLHNQSVIAKTIDQFDAAYLDAVTAPVVADYSADNAVPLFIVGMPRSGSTLLEQMLAQHDQVTATGESCLLERCLSITDARAGYGPMRPALLPELGEASLQQFIQAYQQHIANAISTPVYVDKSLDNYRIIGLILTLFSNARIMVLERNPLDILLSCYQNSFNDLAYTSDLEALADYYISYRQLLQHWREQFADRLITVRYEHLVAEPEAELKRLCEYCGLSWDAGMLDFYRSEKAVNTVSRLQIRQPVYGSSVERWKPYRKLLQPAIGKLRAAGLLSE